jgi:hypothetical protein
MAPPVCLIVTSRLECIRFAGLYQVESGKDSNGDPFPLYKNYYLAHHCDTDSFWMHSRSLELNVVIISAFFPCSAVREVSLMD